MMTRIYVSCCLDSTGRIYYYGNKGGSGAERRQDFHPGGKEKDDSELM